MKIVTPRNRFYIARYRAGLPDRAPNRYVFHGIAVALYLPESIPDEKLEYLEEENGDGYEALPYFALDESGLIYAIRDGQYQLVAQSVVDTFDELKLPLDLA